MNTLELLSTNILDYRKKLGLTQVALADKVGITKKHLLNIEKGRILPSAFIIDQIAAALGVGVGKLFVEPSEKEKKIERIYSTFDKAIDSSMEGIKAQLTKALRENLEEI